MYPPVSFALMICHRRVINDNQVGNFIAAIKADIEGQPWRGDGGRSTIAIIRHNCRFHDRFQGVETPWKMETREWPVLPGTPWNSLITGLETTRGDSTSLMTKGFLPPPVAPLHRADDLLLALSVVSCVVHVVPGVIWVISELDFFPPQEFTNSKRCLSKLFETFYWELRIILNFLEIF